ncbi:hypothetical protein CYY_006921, partial [Polysphondylium violaceum]
KDIKSYDIDPWTSSCPCSDSSLCNPVSVGERQEFMGYSVNGGPEYYNNYDYSTLTSIASFYGPVSSDLVCMAHAKNVRIVYAAYYPIVQLGNMTYQQEWIQSKVELVQSTYADGLNFDVEDPIWKNMSEIAALYTSLVAETTYVFKKLNPNYQITVDIGWRDCDDGRCYDYVGLSQASDYMIVMDYDMQSQIITNDCVAGANSPPSWIIQGMHNFTGSLGIPVNKLLMGLPWYGYSYQCIGSTASINNTVCHLKLDPYLGVNCSDAVGSEIDYGKIMNIIANNTIEKSTPQWDSVNYSPFFNFRADDGTIHQMRYDNPASLSKKVQIAKDLKLRGVAVWNIDELDYQNNPTQSSAMWSSLNGFFE